MKPEELIQQIENKLLTIDTTPSVANIGVVQNVGDGIIQASGLSLSGYNEEVEFENGVRGLVLNLNEDSTSIALLSNATDIKEGDTVKTTGKILGLHVSEKLLGRVVDAVGNPLDGKALKTEGKFYPLEKIAAGVTERQSVDTPLKTGIKAIDAIVPIGRGQRELIIGDRNTGKTAVAIDTIINQKKKDLNLRQVVCIYCAIGQKRSNIARTIGVLQDNQAMDYTIVVAASSSDPAAMQYLAPYAATSIAEYFMDKGQDVLVIYDDLSKHAWAYRQLSLLLRRPAGREAYPGDIFYVHSRLLERSVRMADENGGGSITALPIIETQAGDVSAYIPTNVISITDGQIYLETSLFNSGTRPAINVGLSVSRVGGSAQTKEMKQVAGPLRLELAQFREMAAFAQFGSDLDEKTQQQIERGKRVSEILKQPQYQPYNEAFEVLSIYAASSGLLDDIPVEKINEFETQMLELVSVKNKKLVEKMSSGDKMDEKTLEELKKVISQAKKNFM